MYAIVPRTAIQGLTTYPTPDDAGAALSESYDPDTHVVIQVPGRGKAIPEATLKQLGRLLWMGMTKRQAAEEMGVSLHLVGRYLASRLYRRHRDEFESLYTSVNTLRRAEALRQAKVWEGRGVGL